MIIEDLRVKQDPPRPDTWNGIFRMSSIGGCDAALIAIQQAVPALGNTVTPAMKEGLLHEMDIIMRLKAAGYKLANVLENQIEISLEYPQGQRWPIIGHPDGRIHGGKLPKDLQYVLEIKSMSAFVWPRLKKPLQEAFPVYYGQAQFYLHSYSDTGIPAVLWIAKNRSSGDLQELIIRRDAEYMDNRLAAVSAALKHVKDGDPPSTMSCSSSDYVRKYCPYSYMCNSGSFGKDIPQQVVTDDAIRVTVGQDPAVGKPAIRESFLRRSGRLQQVVELRGIELWGDFVVCRIERKDTTHTASGLEHHLRILLVKEGKIKRLIVVVDPEEDGRLKPVVPD